MTKFNAVQSHTERGLDGHFVSVKGIPAKSGPFEKLKSGSEVAAEDTNGDLRLFNREYWILTKAAPNVGDGKT